MSKVKFSTNGQWQLHKSKTKKFPFNPKTDISDTEAGHTKNWVIGYSDRKKVPQQKGNQLIRGISKIVARTQVRQNPTTQEHEILLHRVMGHKEHSKRVRENYVHHANTTSWGPDLESLSAAYDNIENPRVVSAWVPLSSIKSVPKQSFKPDIADTGKSFKPVTMDPDEMSAFSQENEVIVGPHVSRIHTGKGSITPDDIRRYKEIKYSKS